MIIGFFLASAITFSTISCENNSTSVDTQINSENDTTKPKSRSLDKNPYEGLRHMAFSVTPEQLSLKLSADKIEVYGVVMDWGMEDVIVTTVSYKTGDASMYLSSGGAVIGGGQHQNVNSAAKQFVDLAQTYLDKTTKTEKEPVPIKGEVSFSLLTNKGIYVGKESFQNLEKNSSTWKRLFDEGNKVIAELRLTSER